MKNIHLLQTDKPSRLVKNGNNKLYFTIQTLPLDEDIYCYPQNIYITSDEEIKEGDWVIKISSLYKGGGIAQKYSFIDAQFEDIIFKKIILTTDQELDGVQDIDDTFLEWFVKNPSCESVEIDLDYDSKLRIINGKNFGYYSAIIPQEEPKQETLEEYIKEVTKNFGDEMSVKFTSGGIKLGAKWQQERMYSEEEVIAIVEKSRETGLTAEYLLLTEQFKKK